MTIAGTCFNCHAPCTDEDYCFGCRTIVCAQCSPYFDGPGGPNHRPDDHLLSFMDTVDGEFTCRRVVGGSKDQLTLCGKPAVLSAYCRDHLVVVLDERLAAGRAS